jgi:eukaryotic-like serine/threonine-protein kinase
MALTCGTRLGPYEIQAPLGAGGMGEVYRARDSRLERTVAIKVLNSELVARADLRARFEREAKIISQLQHPHICVLHDVGHEGTTEFLVMEFLEGDSLAERLKKGPLEAGELLRIAVEIADALEKAHRAGVVHRDLKPANVMLTKAGAKLLDFGLAKPFSVGVSAGARSVASTSVFSAALTQTSPAPSPSPSSPLSSAGTVIGTVQYMSPEQIQGVEADERSDIFAFGVMLFEMATGKRAFEGKTQASIVGQILAVDPPAVSTLHPETPPGLDRLIRICLEKDPDERLQTAHDLKLELQRIVDLATAVTQPPVASWRKRWLPSIATVVFALVAMALGVAYVQTFRAPQSSVHAYILPPDKSEFNFLANWAGPPVIAPNGKRVAFVAKKPGGSDEVLWVQPLNSPTAQPMEGTQGAGFPFWSFNSRYVGFFANGKLEKVDANGGPPQTLCDAANGRGGTWNQDDIILFTPETNQPLFKVSAAGGTPVHVTELNSNEGETSHRWPVFLPDGKHFIFWVQGSGLEGGIYAGTLDSRQYKLLVRTASSGAYAEPGYLLFVRDGALMVQKLSTRKLQLEGEAAPLADHVAVNTSVFRSVFTVSANGTLLYLGGGASSGSRLNWYGRDAKLIGPVVPEGALYAKPALSPDGRRLAVAIFATSEEDIWVIDLQRQSKMRLTFGPGRSLRPVWSPDGNWIYYGANQGAQVHIYRRRADGTGSQETVLATEGVSEFPSSITADGRYLAYFREDSKSAASGYDVYVLPLFGDRKPIPEVASKFNEADGKFSPNGNWLAYMSNETGRYEVYVIPFPGQGGKYQVSTGGGGDPQWRGDSRELFFLGSTDTLMAVDVRQKGDALELGTPREILKTSMVSGPTGPFVPTVDGKKFLVNEIGEQKGVVPVTLVTNWTADLR